MLALALIRYEITDLYSFECEVIFLLLMVDIVGLGIVLGSCLIHHC